ncbi:phosphoethanolamine transferase [Aquimarina agarilytica]|uniref:phosphoethanolamine transferase n=1 Tax=Aquimarina agarilytica TaxID=1087449 RepID=UPI0018DED68C|nr:phosphoethanolamine transferase [Aquimarina agarilytica]
MIFVVLSSMLIYKKFNDENILIEIYNSYAEYVDLKTKLKNTLAKEKSDYIKLVSKLDVAQTYVVVIGESTSSWHMQLYDYARETNPLLSEIKDELIIFKDVIAPHVHTIASLEKILTMSDYSNPNVKENSSIIQIANEAGFTTYWLSNQQPIGIDESIPTLIGNAAQHKYFINTDDYGDNVYDEKLLPQLQNILNEDVTKKMVFVHLMGTHTPYKRRYPKEFQFFNNDSGFKLKVNEYDNAIRYNDFVIRNIIEKVRELETNSYVLYFSDHGDEVYDTMDFFGHNEYHATKPMYEVPFIFWFSKGYKKNISHIKESDLLLERKYNLENFVHSFSDVSQINFNRLDSTKSIFSNKFKESKRLIKKGIDYDKD